MTDATTSSLEGQLALVTGASKGIGRACCEKLVASGARVIAVARSADRLETLAEAHAGRIDPWAMNVEDDAFLSRMENLSELNILVNNAGTNQPQSFVDVEDSVLDRMLTLNVRAAFRAARSAGRVMLRTSGNRAIVNMSSQMGHVGSPGRSVCCMTKHAIEGLTRAMAVELAPHGIRVNSVAPTFIATPMTEPMFRDRHFRDWVHGNIPLGRLGDVQEVAAAVAFLASPAASLITGDSLRTDGGWTAH